MKTTNLRCFALTSDTISSRSSSGCLRSTNDVCDAWFDEDRIGRSSANCSSKGLWSGRSTKLPREHFSCSSENRSGSARTCCNADKIGLLFIRSEKVFIRRYDNVFLGDGFIGYLRPNVWIFNDYNMTTSIYKHFFWYRRANPFRPFAYPLPFFLYTYVWTGSCGLEQFFSLSCGFNDDEDNSNSSLLLYSSLAVWPVRKEE